MLPKEREREGGGREREGGRRVKKRKKEIIRKEIKGKRNRGIISPHHTQPEHTCTILHEHAIHIHSHAHSSYLLILVGSYGHKLSLGENVSI